MHLRAAAAHRRERARRRGLASAATAAVAAAALAALFAVGNDDGGVGDRRAAQERQTEGVLPVGTVIPKGEGTPPRDARSTVVATGTAPVAGPWQLGVWRSHGGPSPPGEPRGRCLFIQRLDPGDPSGLTGFCGGLGFRKTPGFSRAELSVPRPGRRFVEELIVYGRVPERARAVVVTPERGSKVMVEPEEGPKSVPGDFFVIPLKPEQAPARINWLDHDGSPGSRGTAVRL
jgi:hypothetical protein